jgi:hypothetical protein
LLSCSDEQRTTKVLSDQGYSNIQTTGHSWSGCSEDDSYCTGFNALSPAGKPVSGVVGCGRSGCDKGCTIRFD